MSHLTFATTAQVPDLAYRTAQAHYQVSREAFIECVEARCAAAEARTTGVWAEDCPPDLKAETQRRVSELRHEAEVVLQVLMARGSYDLATSPDLLDALSNSDPRRPFPVGAHRGQVHLRVYRLPAA